ncbi:MAG TPA: hypothetical protein VHY82_11585 [Acetobacteraceae bacterium]|nr:hypothetical protein [Acetobacteraceae bacterium]
MAAGGEENNGDSLAMIEDAAIATMYAIEAIAMSDHYHFNKAANAATTATPLTLWSPDKSDRPWWRQYYDKSQIQMRDRCLFADVPLPADMAATKSVDWSALDAPSPAARGKKKAAARKRAAPGKQSAAVRKAPAKRQTAPKAKTTRAAKKKRARR